MLIASKTCDGYIRMWTILLLTPLPPQGNNVAFQRCFFNAVRWERWSIYSHPARIFWLLIYEMDRGNGLFVREGERFERTQLGCKQATHIWAFIQTALSQRPRIISFPVMKIEHFPAPRRDIPCTFFQLQGFHPNSLTRSCKWERHHRGFDGALVTKKLYYYEF